MKLTIFLLSFVLSSLEVLAQNHIISFKPEKFTPSQKDYFLVNIIDDRPNKNNIGNVINERTNQSEELRLQGGTIIGLQNLISQKKTANQQAIIVRIKTLKLKEELSAGHFAEGKFTVTLAFERQKEGGNVYLMENTYEAKYLRSLSQIAMVEGVIRKGIVNNLQNFDDWIKKRGGKVEILAKKIELKIYDFVDDKPYDDTVYYERKLTLNDFKGTKPALSKYAGAIFTSMGYNMEVGMKQGVILVKILTKTYMATQASWILEKAKNDYTLAHEQLHFDITKLFVERFKQKLLNLDLHLEDYSSQIQYEYLESFRELTNFQEKYDDETQHGIDTTAQAKWKLKIKNELLAFGF